MFDKSKIVFWLAALVPLMMTYFIVYSRTHGLRRRMRHVLCLISTLALGYLAIFERNIEIGHILYGTFSWPIAAGILYELFDCISLRVNKRTFYLYARGAKDVVGLGFKKHNMHFTFYDRIFSFVLSGVLMMWPVFYVGFFIIISSIAF